MERGIERGYERGREDVRYQREQEAADKAANRQKDIAKFEYELGGDARRFQQELAARRAKLDEDEFAVRKLTNESQRQEAEARLRAAEAAWRRDATEFENRQQDRKSEEPLRQAQQQLATLQAQQAIRVTGRTANDALKAQILETQRKISELESGRRGRKDLETLRKLEADNPYLKDYQVRTLSRGRLPEKYDQQGINKTLDEYNSIKAMLPPELQSQLDDEFVAYLKKKAGASELAAFQRKEQQDINDRALWNLESQDIVKNGVGFSPLALPGIDDINAAFAQEYKNLQLDAPRMTRQEFMARRDELGKQFMDTVNRRMSTTITPRIGNQGFQLPFGNQFQPYGGPALPQNMGPSDQAAQQALQYINSIGTPQQ
jgi:hypothetical protein